MLKNFVVVFIFLTCVRLAAQKIVIDEPVRFLALGDSYTIGESVSVNGRWPVQLRDSLIREGYRFDDLTIFATTGWTTTDLKQSIEENDLDGDYNLVSLLIGVNNQFQGRSVDTYAIEFEKLLQTALELAGNKPNQVFVLSIPDYYFTPWGQSYGSSGITESIEQFNNRNQSITSTYNVPYINITDISRNGIEFPAYVAYDGLHPSETQYSKWVGRILENIEKKSTYIESSNYKDILNIYFNDISNELIIQIRHTKSQNSFRFELFNLQGTQLITKHLSENFNAIHMQDVPQGIYIYRITQDFSQYSGKIFIGMSP